MKDALSRPKNDSEFPTKDRWRDQPKEIVKRLKSARALRSNLLSLASQIGRSATGEGMLVLQEPEMTWSRILKEVEQAKQVFQPHIAQGLRVVSISADSAHGLPEDTDPEFMEWITSLGNSSSSLRRPSKWRPSSEHTVLQVLIRNWLLGQGPVTRMEIRNITGYSYPTVAKAMRALSYCLELRSDRKISLDRFPREEWSRLVAASESVRTPTYYRDFSSDPRSPESLLSRIASTHRRDIGIGGTLGARHYFPDLDVIGTPRLDISLHCLSGEPNLEFLKRVDPGLRVVDRHDQTAILAVHLIRREQPLFEEREDGLNWADPVECLMDLHELRMESQAMQYVDHFEKIRRKAT